jgi:hypothetical protein
VRYALLLLVACGRAHFDVRADAATDAPADAAPDVMPLAEAIVTVDPSTHHLGDDTGGMPAAPEGTDAMAAFTMPYLCGSATLELDFVGPWGPNQTDEPVLMLDGADLGHVFPQLPPMTDPLWSSGDLDGNYDFHVVLPCTPTRGTDTFHFHTNALFDDVFYTNVFVRCEQAH